MSTKIFLLTAIILLMSAVNTGSAYAAASPGPEPGIATANPPGKIAQSVFAGYNRYTLRPSDGTDFTLNGFLIGYNIDFRLLKSHPLYLGTGIDTRFTFRSKEFHEAANYDPADIHVSARFINLNIPVNIGYDLPLGNGALTITPQFGFDFRVQAYGHARVRNTLYPAEKSGSTGGNTVNDRYVRAVGLPSGSYNLFSRSQLGNRVFNRIQAGWHASLKLRVHSMVLGISYGSDFKKLRNELGSSNLLVNMGYYF